MEYEIFTAVPCNAFLATTNKNFFGEMQSEYRYFVPFTYLSYLELKLPEFL